MTKPDSDYDEAAAMQAAQERSAEPHLRDILKREFDEAQTRPRNEAYELWRDAFEGIILRDIEERKKQFERQKQPPAPREPKRDGPDMDMD